MLEHIQFITIMYTHIRSQAFDWIIAVLKERERERE